MVSNPANNLVVPRIEKACILSKGLELKDLESAEKELVEVSPCASERGEVMAEIDLSKKNEEPFLDTEVLCLLLKSFEKHFAEMKCSPRLGVGRLMWKARRLYVYENGKFKVRFAHDREDAIKTLNSLIRLLLGSIICGNCGEAAVRCITGECGTCTTSKPSREIQLDEYFNEPILKKGLESLEEALIHAYELDHDAFLKGDWSERGEKRVRRKLLEAIEFAMSFSLETSDPEGRTIGILLESLARENIIFLNQEKALAEMSEKDIPPEIKEETLNLVENLWRLNENLIRSLRGKETENLEEIDKKLSKSLKEIKSSEQNENWQEKDFGDILEKLKKRLENSKTLLAKIKSV